MIKEEWSCIASSNLHVQNNMDDNDVAPSKHELGQSRQQTSTIRKSKTKSYLPSETPKGLVDLRKKELENIRGNDLGDPKAYNMAMITMFFKRIYRFAYDVDSLTMDGSCKTKFRRYVEALF